MKKLFFILFLLVTQLAHSQSNWNMRLRQDFQLADFAFYQEDYVYALNLLRTIYKSDSTHGPVLYEYGTSLLILNRDKEFAKSLLKKAVDAGETEAIFWYAKSLHQSGESNQAIAQYKKYKSFLSKEVSNEEVDRHINMAITYSELKASPVDVQVENVGSSINSDNKEYVPLITGDGMTMYFTSRRKNKLHDKLDNNNEYYEDIYRCTKNKGKWSEAELLGEKINTETHDATVAISGDGNTMLIYRTNRKLTGGDLYITELKYGFWNSPKKLNHNINSSYQEASATLSNDGSNMYFSSNRPGGFGGKDLYIVRKLPNGEWSKAKNLGGTINTKHDEDAPFINSVGNILYFSSNGHNTMGGYDVFKCNLNEDFWSEPQNLGYPINTVEDEIYMTLDETECLAYYSSDKGNGFGQLDIYEIEFTYREEKDLLAFGKVIDKNNQPINATLTIYNDDTKKLNGIYKTNDQSGKFMLALHPKTKYSILLEAEGYNLKIESLFITDISNDLIEFALEPYYLTLIK